ncbi:hypothetical protein BGZ94_004508 [Podila epigama]|nr:hypothetical protein BGZ94_004508 [Podila epigama]
MKFTVGTAAAMVLATIAFAASTADALTCYQRCIKDGGSGSYCSGQCYDKTCYRACIKDGFTWQYCQTRALKPSRKVSSLMPRTPR